MHLQQILRQHRTILFALTLCVVVPAAQAQLVAIEENTGELYGVSTTDAALDLIGPTGLTDLGALEFNPYDGVLYGLTTGADAALYRFVISPTLDDVTAYPIGELGIYIYEGGLAFAPDGTAYGVNGGVTTSVLFTLDLDTGQATPTNTLSGRHDIAGLGWRDDGLLVGLDSTTGTLLTIDPVTAQIGHIEDMAPIIGSIGGMVLAGGDTGYFSTAGLHALTPGSNELYSFNPYSGDHTQIGLFDDTVITGAGFAGLSVIPEPTTLGLLILGSVGLLRRRAT